MFAEKVEEYLYKHVIALNHHVIKLYHSIATVFLMILMLSSFLHLSYFRLSHYHLNLYAEVTLLKFTNNGIYSEVAICYTMQHHGVSIFRFKIALNKKNWSP